MLRIDSLVQLVPGAATPWSDAAAPVPVDVYVYDTNNKILKIGDGSNIFINLPVFLDIQNIIDGVAIDLSRLETGNPNPSDNDKIVIINDSGKFEISITLLTTIIDRLNAIIAKDISQQNDLDIVEEGSNKLITLIDSNRSKLTIINNGVIIPDGISLEENKNNEISIITQLSYLRIYDIKFYLDMLCENEVTELNEYNEYYAKIFAEDTNGNPITYSLSYEPISVVLSITQTTTDNVFKITLNDIDSDNILSFTATCANGVSSGKQITRDIPILSFLMKLNMDNTSNDNIYNDIAIDNDDNIVAVGSYTDSGGNSFGMISKYDKDLNILHQRYLKNAECILSSIVVDNNGDYVAVGTSYESGNVSGLIVKFSSIDLQANIQTGGAKKIFSGTNDEKFFGIAVDNNNNYMVVGYSTSSVSIYRVGIIIKFSSDCNIINKKYLFEDSSNSSITDIKIDHDDKIVIIGSTDIGAVEKAFIMRLDTALMIEIEKTYSVNNDPQSLLKTYFNRLAIDNNNNYIIAGNVSSDSNEIEYSFIVKFNNLLNTIAIKKVIGAISDLTSVAIDKLNNYIFSGFTLTSGILESFILKYDESFSGVSRKISRSFATPNQIYGIAALSNNNYVAVGYMENISLLNNIVYAINQFLPEDSSSYVGSVTDIVYDQSVLNIISMSLYDIQKSYSIEQCNDNLSVTLLIVYDLAYGEVIDLLG